MPIQVSPATLADALALCDVGNLAFENNLFTRMAMSVENATPDEKAEYLQWRTDRMKKRMQEPNSHYFKAVDDETGEYVGFTGVFGPTEKGSGASEEGPNGQDQRSRLPKVVNVDVVNPFERALKDVRDRLLKDRKDYWYIHSMAVHPSHQRRGIGAKLLQAHVQLGNNAKQQIYLEAMPEAVKLYASAGFKTLYTIPVLDDKLLLTAMLKDAESQPVE